MYPSVFLFLRMFLILLVSQLIHFHRNRYRKHFELDCSQFSVNHLINQEPLFYFFELLITVSIFTIKTIDDTLTLHQWIHFLQQFLSDLYFKCIASALVLDWIQNSSIWLCWLKLGFKIGYFLRFLSARSMRALIGLAFL